MRNFQFPGVPDPGNPSAPVGSSVGAAAGVFLRRPLQKYHLDTYPGRPSESWGSRGQRQKAQSRSECFIFCLAGELLPANTAESRGPCVGKGVWSRCARNAGASRLSGLTGDLVLGSSRSAGELKSPRRDVLRNSDFRSQWG